MYYQVEHGEDLNKIYQPPYPSGAGAIPYNWGWSNKYSPKPYGLRVRPSTYSYLASPYISNPLRMPNLTQSSRDNFYSGPVNGIYEVEVSGITNIASGCIKADVLNQTYLLYFLRSQSEFVVNHTNGFPGNPVWAGQAGNNVYWFGRTCNANRPVNICNVDSLVLGLEIDRFGGDDFPGFQSSGNLSLSFAMYFGRNSHPFQFNGSIQFSKQFGYVETQNPLYKSVKPNMMEGEYLLSPISSGGYFNVSQPAVFVNQGGSTDDYWVDLTNAVVKVRPYKSAFYDIKNADKNFYSGEYYPIYADEQWQGQGIPNVNWRGFNDYSAKTISSSRNYYLNNATHYDKLIGNSGVRGSGHFYFIPYSLALSFNDVGSGVRHLPAGCRPIDEYFSKKKNLNIFYYPNGIFDQDVIYTWRGYAQTENQFNTSLLGGTSIDYNYYNLCDCACPTWRSRQIFGSDFQRLPPEGYGPCNNLIELHMSESGIFPSLTFEYSGLTCTATMYFGAVFGSGVSMNEVYLYSKKCLTKTFCKNDVGNSGNFTPCAFIGDSSLLLKGGFINYFDEKVWSSGWILQENSGLFPYLPDYMDIANYCDFSSGNVIIKPEPFPQTPCSAVRCTICDGRYVPQTANLTIVHGSGIDDSNYILSNDIQPSFPTYGGKAGCVWDYHDDSGNNYTLSFAGTDNSGLAYFTLNLGFFEPVLFTQNTGKVVDFRIDCNEPLTPVGGGSSYSVTFSDLYDILDYI